MVADKEHILVIKHGALGDIVLSTGPFAAIRAHHPDAHITLLTTKPYDKLLADSPYFDEIWLDTRPKLWRLLAWWRLHKMFRAHPFVRVYDLQTSSRSTLYYKICPKMAKWSGIAKGAAFEHNTPHRTRSHTIDRHKEQLALAGIQDVPPPDVSWLTSDTFWPDIPESFALLIPGGSAHRPEKRWPVEFFAGLAEWLAGEGITPVLIGTNAESDLLDYITGYVPAAVNCCNKTSFADLAELGRKASVIIGNDTGPMHLGAATKTPSIVLFSNASDPALCAPPGGHVTVLRRDNLSDLEPDEVMDAIKNLRLA